MSLYLQSCMDVLKIAKLTKVLTIEPGIPLENVHLTHYKNNSKYMYKPQPEGAKSKLTCLALNCQERTKLLIILAAIIEEYKPDIILGNES